jgi:hypothetical protein
MWPLSPLPQPPLPQRIKEYLGEYPDLLERLQQGLNDVVLEPSLATPPFEVAIWALKDSLETFYIDAQAELHAARDAGDAMAITRAEKKEIAVGYAGSSGYGMRDLRELRQYFEENRQVL